MLGQVGNDPEGKSYIEFLKKNHVKVDHVNVLNDKATGQAFILSIQEAQMRNSILIVGGANQAYDQSYHLPKAW